MHHIESEWCRTPQAKSAQGWKFSALGNLTNLAHGRIRTAHRFHAKEGSDEAFKSLSRLIPN
jgi:hypothetical protein